MSNTPCRGCGRVGFRRYPRGFCSLCYRKFLRARAAPADADPSPAEIKFLALEVRLRRPGWLRREGCGPKPRQ
jgi:hypothetical protein